MKYSTKPNLSGKLIEKEDLGKYSKRFGIEPLVTRGKEELFARLYQ
jgi:hypothetical protein